MKRAERDEWVAALRSGDYKQGKSRLNAGDQQCCLGVKCLLDVAAGRHGIVENVTIDVTFYTNHTWDGIGNFQMPTSSIYSAWGMDYEQVGTLASMNDAGFSFEEIADWIEENVEVED